MKYLGTKEISKLWKVSERSVRNYCREGKVEGAVFVGKTWQIPENAMKPKRVCGNNLLFVLKEEKSMKYKGGIYHKTQIELTYNSNHIEGSRLTEEQTRLIFETNTIGVSESVNVDDIIETTNHFRCIDYIIDNATKPLTEMMIKKLHYMLKSGTSDAKKDWFNVGEYKKLPNEIGGKTTCLPENVAKEMRKLLEKYKNEKTFESIVAFHHDFEVIHPFQDGNGRIGRLIMFKECLHHNIVPFIIDSAHKIYYYRGLSEWENVHGFLIETCLSAQDTYKKWLDYFKIKY